MNTAKKSIIAAGALFLLMSTGPVMAADQEMADSSTALRTQDRIDRDDALKDQDQLKEQIKLQERTRTRTRTRTRDRVSRPNVSSSRPDFSRPSMGSRPHSR